MGAISARLLAVLLAAAILVPWPQQQLGSSSKAPFIRIAGAQQFNLEDFNPTDSIDASAAAVAAELVSKYAAAAAAAVGDMAATAAAAAAATPSDEPSNHTQQQQQQQVSAVASQLLANATAHDNASAAASPAPVSVAAAHPVVSSKVPAVTISGNSVVVVADINSDLTESTDFDEGTAEDNDNTQTIQPAELDSRRDQRRARRRRARSSRRAASLAAAFERPSSSRPEGNGNRRNRADTASRGNRRRNGGVAAAGSNSRANSNVRAGTRAVDASSAPTGGPAAATRQQQQQQQPQQQQPQQRTAGGSVRQGQGRNQGSSSSSSNSRARPAGKQGPRNGGNAGSVRQRVPVGSIMHPGSSSSSSSGSRRNGASDAPSRQQQQHSAAGSSSSSRSLPVQVEVRRSAANAPRGDRVAAGLPPGSTDVRNRTNEGVNRNRTQQQQQQKQDMPVQTLPVARPQKQQQQQQPVAGAVPPAAATQPHNSNSSSSNNNLLPSSLISIEGSLIAGPLKLPPTLQNSTNASSSSSSRSSRSSGDVEQQQLAALQQLLPKLLTVGSESWPLVKGLFNGAPQKLSDWLPADKAAGVRDYTEFVDTRGYGFISVTLIREHGKVYVTELYAYDAGLNLTVLPDLVSQMPRITTFTCSNCNRNSGTAVAAAVAGVPQLQLPDRLAELAPASLTMLSLGSSGIKGTLPESWSKWQTLEQLWVWDNELTGTIPASWSNMTKLRVFYAEQNKLTGELPASWGSGVLPDSLAVYLHANEKLSGAVPETWSRFSGVIDVSSTNVTGCVPDLLVDNIITDGTPEPCSPNDPNAELTALLGIRTGMRQMLGQQVLGTWSDEGTFTTELTRAGEQLPKHCSSWRGITCNVDGHVTILDLSFLNISKSEVPVATPLPKMMQFVKRLKHLQVLNLSNLGLTGLLQEDRPLSDDMSRLASDLTQLRILNISGNPGVTGRFPRLWAGLTSLQVLDVSGTGVASKLPDSWASLQQLQVFRASNTQISGNLPNAWGMLKSLQEVDLTGTNLTGPLPAQWGDAAAMQAVAQAAVLSAQQAAVQAQAAAEQAMQILLASKDNMRMRLGASPDGASLNDAAAGVGAAMDAYHQVQVEAQQAQAVAEVLQLAFTKAADDMKLQGYGLGMMNLQVLKLGRNQLNGPLPVSYASFRALRVLDLSHNELAGTLPMEYAALDSLQDLNLSHNPRLEGKLPDYWGRLTNLQRLDLSNCGLSGKLPTTWVALQNAVSINLSNNMLGGDVPEAWGFMTATKYKLRCLNLAGNPGITNLVKTKEVWQENSPVRVVTDLSQPLPPSCM